MTGNCSGPTRLVHLLAHWCWTTQTDHSSSGDIDLRLRRRRTRERGKASFQQNPSPFLRPAIAIYLILPRSLDSVSHRTARLRAHPTILILHSLSTLPIYRTLHRPYRPVTSRSTHSTQTIGHYLIRPYFLASMMAFSWPPRYPTRGKAGISRPRCLLCLSPQQNSATAPSIGLAPRHQVLPRMVPTIRYSSHHH